MKNEERATSPNVNMKQLTEVWKRRMMAEKNYPKEKAVQIVERLKALATYMQKDYAIIAYYKLDGNVQLTRGTLIPYSRHFNQPFDIAKIHSTFAYWDIEQGGWRTFQIENFLEWEAII